MGINDNIDNEQDKVQEEMKKNEEKKENLTKENKEKIINVLNQGNNREESFNFKENILNNIKELYRLAKFFDEWKTNPEQTYEEISRSLEKYKNQSNKNIEEGDKFTNLREGGSRGNINNYCYFNILGINDKSFKISDFLDKNKEFDRDNITLIRPILSLYFNNYCEQSEYYEEYLYKKTTFLKEKNSDSDIYDKNFQYVKLIKPSQLTKGECMHNIRNCLAHGKYQIVNMGNKIEIRLIGESFEVIINPAFFDIGFHLALYSNNLPCIYIKEVNENNEDNKNEDYTQIFKRSIYKYEKKAGIGNPDINSIIGANFKKGIEELFNNDYYAIHINLDTGEREKEKQIIDSSKMNDVGLLIGLVSDTNKQYINNLFNAVTINILNKIISNHNISYKELIESRPDLTNLLNIYSINDQNEIVKYCIENINNLLKVGCLKEFYTNILEIKSSGNRTEKEKEQAHIRNALTHGYYKIIDSKIIMRDYDKKRKIITKEKSIYNIDDLFNNEIENNLHQIQNDT